MADKLVDVIVKLGQSGKKDQPSKPYVVTMLIFQIKRTIKSEKWFNNVITLFLFFSFFFSLLKIPNIWVGRTTLNGKIKGDGQNRIIKNV